MVHLVFKIIRSLGKISSRFCLIYKSSNCLLYRALEKLVLIVTCIYESMTIILNWGQRKVGDQGRIHLITYC